MSTAEQRPIRPRASLPGLLRKVPDVTALFWVTKVLTTGMGETASDYVVHRADPILAVGLAAWHWRPRWRSSSFPSLRAWIYWGTASMVSVFGTMAADVVHVGLGVPYAVSTLSFVSVLAIVFVAWYATEHTLSIHSIRTRRRELFYWATVLTTFALGTAAGDMTASTIEARLPRLRCPVRRRHGVSAVARRAWGSTSWRPSGSRTSSPAPSARRSRTGWACRRAAVALASERGPSPSCWSPPSSSSSGT